MSKIGLNPIEYNKDNIIVTVEKGGEFNHLEVTVKGPKGEQKLSLRKGIEINEGDGVLNLVRKNESTKNKSLHGLYRSLINNMILGVQEGYSKKLEIHGVGYRGAQIKDNEIELKVGFSHPVVYTSPLEGIAVKMENDTTIEISGINKQQVGQIAAEIRSIKKPEPYKGKGIRYQGEQVRRKAGKAGIAATT